MGILLTGYCAGCKHYHKSDTKPKFADSTEFTYRIEMDRADVCHICDCNSKMEIWAESYLEKVDDETI